HRCDRKISARCAAFADWLLGVRTAGPPGGCCLHRQSLAESQMGYGLAAAILAGLQAGCRTDTRSRNLDDDQGAGIRRRAAVHGAAYGAEAERLFAHSEISRLSRGVP